MRLPIVQGENAGRAKVISVNSCINMYPEIQKPGQAKNATAFRPAPGFEQLRYIGLSGYCRGMHVMVWNTYEYMYVVVGNQLIQLDEGFVETSIGYISTSVGSVVMCDNGTQLLITDGIYGYVYNMATTTLTPLTSDPDYPSSTSHCVFMNGYFLVNSGKTGKFYFSNLYDGANWDALDYMTAEYAPDNLLGLAKTSNGILWLFGRKTTELWQTSNDPNAPFIRIDGAIREIGVLGRYTIVSNGDVVFWLGYGRGDTAGIYMGTGYEIRKISTPSIEYQIKNFATYSHLRLAYAFSYTEEGHTFYLLTVVNLDTFVDKTWVYDVATDQWHIRQPLGGGAIISRGYAYFRGKHYTGSKENTNFYIMSEDVFDDNGYANEKIIITNVISDENKLLRHKSFELDTEKGVGQDGGVDPKWELYMSNDGGHTFGSLITKPYGKVSGDPEYYTVRVRWVGLGSARNRVYKLRTTGSVKNYISGAYVEIR